MIDVTVCIPTYNAVAVVERAIRSVLDQRTSASIEILVCDDGSSDGTAAAVATLAESNPSIRLLRNGHNRGRPFTRNRLVREARGRFLTWLDADDEKYPDMVEAQWQRLRDIESSEGPHAVRGTLVFVNFHWWWPNMETPRVMAPPESDDPMEPLLDSSFGGYLWLMMGLRETFLDAGPFDERLPRLQDLGFFIRFAELGGRFVRVATDEPLCSYHKDDGGRDALVVWRSWNRIWRRYHHHFVSYGMPNARKWRRHHYRVSRRFARANDDRLAFWLIAASEVAFLVRGRCRRVVFDA